jgi:SARP family transcriptional regulator, regulator of embCAB operon
LTLRAYLAGNVSLECDGVLVPEKMLPGRQGRVLLTALAWERVHAVTAEEVADILWDGGPPTAWQVALRSLMSKLRAALADVPADVRIEHAFGSYQLRLPADAWVDVEAASAAVHEAEAAMREGDLAGATGAALVANAIARRPFLQGDEGEWVTRKRGELLGIRLRALAVRGQVALMNDDPTGALTDAEIIVGADPYRETAYVLLMSAHAAAGNSARAIAVYEQLRARLADDLGVGPSPTTEAVFLEIVRGTR